MKESGMANDELRMTNVWGTHMPFVIRHLVIRHFPKVRVSHERIHTPPGDDDADGE
jgi:hypothetical protein